MRDNDKLSDKDEKEMKRLEDKLRSSKIDVEAIPGEEKPDAKSWKLHKLSSVFDLTHAERLYFAFCEKSDEDLSFDEWSRQPLKMRRDYGT